MVRRKKSKEEKEIRKYFKRGFRKIRDIEMDHYLQDGIDRIKEESVEKLSLHKTETQIFDPLVVKAPILYQTEDVDKKDLVWKVGKDGIARFGLYSILIIHLTERHLAAFGCVYNLIRDVSLSEYTNEFHYQDIVSVSTKELSSSFTLPSGEKLTYAQEFAITVSSGDSISVLITTGKLEKTKKKYNYKIDTGAEKAVKFIRQRLREKKA